MPFTHSRTGTDSDPGVRLTDYRLDRLSPRHFEHVVQQLAYGEISSTITPFGDGPDGGREATFDGPTHYGADGSYWDGYGIIQAKYRTRPHDTGQDAIWACEQLRDELKQYSRKDNPRSAPEYYIFAVNVVLSPGEGKGKDTVLAILQDFASTYNLKGFDLWDYDKFRLLLTHNEKVRNANLAWICPSDVLAQLCAMLNSQERDYYPLILKYLQRELIADQYAKLEQAGHSGDDAIPLSQVFIDLPTVYDPPSSDTRDAQQPDTPRFVEFVIEETNHSLHAQDEGAVSQSSSFGHSKSIQKKRGRYVLIGGPGQGKTTIGQYVCQIFRGFLLSDVPRTRLSAEAITALDALTSGWNSNPPAARRLPFRVVLGEFAKSLASGEVNSLLGYLAKKFSAYTDTSVVAVEIETILQKYPSLIVLDGLDEVPPSTNRDAVLKSVVDFSIDIATGGLDVVIIATSRPQGYSQEFSAKQYSHHYLMPLPAAVALQYGNQLARIRFGASTDRSNKVMERLHRASANIATARLMTTPLQVTILTLLVDRIGRPPEERWSLFSAYYRLIVERETERDIDSVAVLREHSADVDAIHRRVGLALQVESERSGGTDAQLTTEQFGQIVEDYLVDEGHEGGKLKDLKDRIIYAAANRLVFLVGLESGRVGFEIRSLQEFMAAEGLLDGPDGVVQNRLKQVAASTHWRNAFLFAAGKCFEHRRYLWDTIEAVCFELNDDPNDSFRYLLVGSTLALDLLEDGPARKQPNKLRSLTRLALELLNSDASVARSLADICEDDTRHIFLEKIRDGLAIAGPTASRAWRCLTFLVDRYGGDFQVTAQDFLAQNSLPDYLFQWTVEAATGANEWLRQYLFERLRESGMVLGRNLSGGNRKSGSTSGKFGPWELSDYPDWLAWYATYISESFPHRSGSPLRIVAGSDETGSIIAFMPLVHANNHLLIPPEGIPDTGRWRFVAAAGHFVAEPGSATLAAALREYAEYRAEVEHADRMIYRYPWPLAECLLAIDSGAGSEVVNAVEGGKFGDLPDWQETERQMLEGVEAEVIAVLPSVAGGADCCALYRFPFRANWRRTANVSIPEVLDALPLVSAFDVATGPIVRQFIGELLLDPYPFEKNFGRLRGCDWVDRVLWSIIVGEDYLSPIFYELWPPGDQDNTAWSNLFAKAPMSIFTERFVYRLRDDYVRSLTDLWNIGISAKATEGLLVPFAIHVTLLAPTVREAIIRRVPALEQSPSPVRFAALLINIAAGIDIDELQDDVRWSMTLEEVGLFEVLADVVSTRGLSYAEECNQLLKLLALAPQHAQEAHAFLQRNFLRGQSGLSRPEVWAQLELPRDILNVLG